MTASITLTSARSRLRGATAKKLWALDSPKFTVEKDVLMFAAGNEPVTFPLPAFLIEHERGLVLVDSMLDPAAAADPEAVYGPLAAMISEFEPDQTVPAQLHSLGYDITDVTHVVVSHLHFDHAGGLKLFPHAKFYVGRGEWAHACSPPAASAGFFRAEDLEPIRGFHWLEVPGQDHDLFGDGSIVLLWAPGHTAGQLAVLLRLPSQDLILATDAGHLRETYELEMPTPFDYDTVAAVNSIRRIKTLADGLDARVWISHDADDWAELPHAPACLD